MAIIDKPTDYFNTVLYTGNGVDNRDITGLDFQPDMLWSKRRDSADNHSIYDIVRGSGLELRTQTTDADLSRTNNIQALQTNGFQVGDDSQVNASGGTYVSWGWSAGGAGVSNTDGSITSTVSANTTSGFSIVSYTGNATAGATVGHGVGSALDMIIVKKRSSTGQWVVGHKAMDSTFDNFLFLDSTSAKGNADNVFNDTAPTSSLFSIGNAGDTNASGQTYIAYCFAEKKGFSKFGSYTGNGSADGTFVYTGFRPAMVIIKRTSGADRWAISDNKRDPDNPVIGELNPNDSVVEDTSSTPFDFLSNGFKIRRTGNVFNGSGESYIYMCFAENPLVSSAGVPCTAR